MMSGLFLTIFVYILGGLTFLPLILCGLLAYVYLTCPYVGEKEPTIDLIQADDGEEAIQVASANLDEKFKARGAQENDVSSGYFAVSREYVPGGVGAKPPERTTPTGSTTISSPSPSVYQSMYRSLFDRKPSVSPIDNKGAQRPIKKGGNIFYVVLRHSHLMLFDDEEQLEVRYVISLAHHNVSIYGGGEHIPEGELFIKRNALCLSRRTDAGELTPDGVPSKPFFLFSENTSDKEDFYFAMLKNQERKPESTNNPPVPLQFDVKHIIGLVQRLHSSEEHLQTRWLNALIGRIFLGLYKTTDVENFLRAKITKKISRVKTPSFLSKIELRTIHLGDSAPLITNPRLKDLTVDGDCVVEMDVKYTGNIRVEIATAARIELGARFKAREVDLVLAVVLKKIEGHVYVRVKPPPSNRVWFTFTSMPKIELSVEPIVSARQITYTIILRQIENRIKEVFAESVVMPFWDDSPFFSTEEKKWRGGVWVDDTVSYEHDTAEEIAAKHGEVDEVETMEGNGPEPEIESMERSATTPPESTSTPLPGISLRKSAKSLLNVDGVSSKIIGTSSGIDSATKPSLGEKGPRSMRIGSFSSTASAPVVVADTTNVDAFKTSTPMDYGHAAATAMAALSAKSHNSTPVGSPSRAVLSSPNPKLGSFSSVDTNSSDDQDDLSKTIGNLQDERKPDPSTANIDESSLTLAPEIDMKLPKPVDRVSTSLSTASTLLDEPSTTPNKKITLSAMATAAQNAKKWGLDALAARRAAQQVLKEANQEATSHVSQPMGRGRPLPPPGMPLPPPDRKTKTAAMPVPKRKPIVPPPPYSNEELITSLSPPLALRDPPLPKRRSQSPIKVDHDGDRVFVVEAPDSEPVTPLVERKDPLIDKIKSAQRPSSYQAPTVDSAEDVDLPSFPNSRVLSSLDSRPESPPKLPSRHNKDYEDSVNIPALPKRRHDTVSKDL